MHWNPTRAIARKRGTQHSQSILWLGGMAPCGLSSLDLCEKETGGIYQSKTCSQAVISIVSVDWEHSFSRRFLLNIGKAAMAVMAFPFDGHHLCNKVKCAGSCQISTDADGLKVTYRRVCSLYLRSASATYADGRSRWTRCCKPEHKNTAVGHDTDASAPSPQELCLY